MKERLVFIPGTAVGGDLWLDQIERLSDICDIIVPDISNCSSRGEMSEVILSSSETPFSVVAISLGTWIGFRCAAEYPENINRLCVISTWVRPEPKTDADKKEIEQKIKDGFLWEAMKSHIEYSVSPFLRGDPEFIAFLKKSTENVKKEDMIRHLEIFLKDGKSKEYLASITCPTLVIAGKEDTVSSVEDGKEVADSIRDARFEILEDCGHFAPFERPEALSSLLRTWIADTRGKTA